MWPTLARRKNNGCRTGHGFTVRTPNYGGALTILPHNQHVSALVLRGQENLRHHDQDLALARRVDVPDALHIGGVIAGIVG